MELNKNFSSLFNSKWALASNCLVCKKLSKNFLNAIDTCLGLIGMRWRLAIYLISNTPASSLRLLILYLLNRLYTFLLGSSSLSLSLS
jgi:hypothetical protein